MQTQVSCPRCQTPFVAEVHQMIDVGVNPSLKRLLLSGQLNVVQCPSCSTVFPVLTPLVYHDPENQMFMVHVPMELNIPTADRERLIGRMVQQAMTSLPESAPKGYLLQPETILTLQTFMERVLETEGITKEMIERQRAQVELVNTLATADRDVVDYLLKERAKEIDETFFSILQSVIEEANQTGQEERAIKLINLRVRLFQETEVGRQLEKRQVALTAFQKEAQKAGALTPEIYLKHLVKNAADEEILDTVIAMGQQALSYEFFSLLTEEIEKKQQLGGDTAAQPLMKLREKLLAVYDELQQQSQQIMVKAGETLNAILTADDYVAEIRNRLDEIDDAFMYVLSANIGEFEKGGQQQQADALKQIYQTILALMEEQAPAEVRFVNQLVRTRDPEARRQLLDENPAMVQPELVQVLTAVRGEAEGAGQQALIDHIDETIRMIEAKLALAGD
ncbi:MAG: CpXC domain-containing protein [Anaerolineales bacterium]|nr:CpXC domain-containing protein [Anaerolineales bacterium]